MNSLKLLDDPQATRTLFVGNLEVTIQDADLRRIFDKYGVIEDIDVKRPPPGQGNRRRPKFCDKYRPFWCSPILSGVGATLNAL